ncbi:MAG TPA: hypothetical protein VLK23_02545 [Thermodesulfobacteriota bacterium]|nr:hypothetical protein [Thermodesulfobacteriota bacterium]
MGYGKFCKYYLNSRCVLEGTYCDLHCNRVLSHHDYQFYDEYDKIDSVSEWRIEEEVRRQRRKKKEERRFS